MLNAQAGFTSAVVHIQSYVLSSCREMQLTASSSGRVENQPTTSVPYLTLKAISVQDQVTSTVATTQMHCYIEKWLKHLSYLSCYTCLLAA